MQAAGGGQSLAPEHMGQLVGLLEAGLSPEAHVRQPAEAVLDSWKELPGYFSLLKELVVSPPTFCGVVGCGDPLQISSSSSTWATTKLKARQANSCG